MLKMIKLNTLLPHIIGAGEDLQYDITIDYTIYNGDTSSEDQFYIPGMKFLRSLQRFYSQWSYVVDDDTNVSPDEEFYLCFEEFCNYYVTPVYSRVITAILSVYNPLENYDGFEVEEIKAHTRGHQSGKVSGESSAGASDLSHYETTYDDGTTSDHLKYKDSSAQNEPSTSETDYGVMIEGTDGNIQLDNAHLQNATDGNNRRDLHEHGNMGTKTTQSIIKEELEIRTVNILQNLVKQFADQYLVMVGGDDD